MSNIIKRTRVWVITACLLAFTLSSSTAFAWGGHWGGHWGRGHWHWWWPGCWFGWGVAATALTVGAVVGSLPHGYTTVVVGGTPYYYYDDVYYRPAPGGYVVVQEPTPVAVVQEPVVSVVNPTPVEENIGGAIVINVPNGQGGYTPVQLTRHGNGYIGPQGEYYEHPTVKQLKALYGR